MLLAIDVGNTNTVFAVFEKNVLKHTWRCTTESARSADQYAVFLKQLFNLEDLKWSDIRHVIISSVVPDTHFHLSQFCEKYFELDTVFGSSKNTPITVDLSQPQEIGADRLVNAMAVKDKYTLPCVVIDFGTATTFDVIVEGGIYRGGAIAPGVRLSIEALTNRAAKLPKITIEKPERAIGKNTQEAMQSGMYWGYVGMIESILTRIKEELGKETFVIATGGLAPLYAQSTNMINKVDNDLIFKGLYEIYQYHKTHEGV